jgi:hypothetical protein
MMFHDLQFTIHYSRRYGQREKSDIWKITNSELKNVRSLVYSTTRHDLRFTNEKLLWNQRPLHLTFQTSTELLKSVPIPTQTEF